jgi:transcriptional regulator with XRE-family HTH domain
MRQYKPLSEPIPLAPTLAQRLVQLREMRNLTCRDLARYSRLPLKRVEDIESGIETWLSSVDRQKIAKALVIEPSVLQEVEVRNNIDDEKYMQEICEQIAKSILAGAANLECPSCGGRLKSNIQDALDIEGNSTYFARAFCLNCPFVLK